MNEKDTRAPNPLTDDSTQNQIPLSIVIDCVGKVIKTPALKMGDTGRYHIPINFNNTVKTITLSTAHLMGGHKPFSTQFTDLFGKRLFFKKDNEWFQFFDWLIEIAEEGEPDETPAMVAGYMLIEEMASRWKVSTDKTPLKDGDGCRELIEHAPHGETYYVVPSGAIGCVLDELPGNVPLTDVSQALTVAGYKVKNTAPVTPKGATSIRCWWFIVDKMKEINQTLGDDE